MSNGSQMSCLARHGRPRQSRSKALCGVVSNERAAVTIRFLSGPGSLRPTGPGNALVGSGCADQRVAQQVDSLFVIEEAGGASAASDVQPRLPALTKLVFLQALSTSCALRTALAGVLRTLWPQAMSQG